MGSHTPAKTEFQGSSKFPPCDLIVRRRQKQRPVDDGQVKHKLFSHLLPVYPCTQEHTLFLMHCPPFLQGGLHTAGVGETKRLVRWLSHFKKAKIDKSLCCRDSLFTIVALCAVEAVGTLADVRPHAGASIQTDRRTKSLEMQRLERSRRSKSEGVRVLMDSLTSLARRSGPAGWTQAFVRRNALSSVVTVAAAHHCQSLERQFI